MFDTFKTPDWILITLSTGCPYRKILCESDFVAYHLNINTALHEVIIEVFFLLQYLQANTQQYLKIMLGHLFLHDFQFTIRYHSTTSMRPSLNTLKIKKKQLFFQNFDLLNLLFVDEDLFNSFAEISTGFVVVNFKVLFQF
jgi:hypothetical protein